MTVELTVRAGPPRLDESEGRSRLVLPTDEGRGEAKLVARLERPSVVRDALIALSRVYKSDLRFKASDRSDYLAFLLKQGKRATKELWEAQKAFLDERFSEATGEESPLDPVVTVSNDGLSIEVMSADESSYARLFLRDDGAYRASERQSGVTYLAMQDGAEGADGFDGTLRKIRGFRETVLELGASGEPSEPRELRVPERWVRAFSQVQAASTLPTHGFTLSPVDFYNLLFTLRMQRAKTSPRALRYELVPGDRPRMVLEPWDLLIETVGERYDGPRPEVVRTFGRRRLSMLSPLLPHLERVRVYPTGPGLPVFYELDLGDATLTLALSGWTDRGWAGISSFDLLVPPDVERSVGEAALEALASGPATLCELCERLDREPAEVRSALLVEIQLGRVLHERGEDRYRARALFEAPLDLESLRYRDAVEEQAHRWLAVEGQVRILKTHDLGDEGFRIEGEVEDKHARRTYRTSFTLDREGRTVNASCTSRQFRRSGLKEGPTAPMIALRLRYAREKKELEAARQTEAGRRLIRAETRTMLRREGERSLVHKVSLDDRQVVLRFGRAGAPPRTQRLLFGTPDGARNEYFRRLSDYEDRGFIDASRSEAIG